MYGVQFLPDLAWPVLATWEAAHYEFFIPPREQPFTL
jgi:hypothetical protein